MKNVFDAAQGIFDSNNFRRINCRFEDDIVDALVNDLSKDNQRWETEINKNGIKSDRSKKEQRIDLCLLEDNQIKASIEVKVFEQYNNKSSGHLFPYIFYDNAPPVIKNFNGCEEQDAQNLNCFDIKSDGKAVINHKEEGQLFKDIVKQISFDKNGSSFEKYILIYMLSNDNKSVIRNYNHINGQLGKLLKKFDEISNGNGKYCVKTDQLIISAKYIPLSYTGFYKSLDEKNIGNCCKDRENLGGTNRNISIVLLKFKLSENFTFELQKV